MRIAGITIPDTQQLEFALTAVYGVGRSRAREIVAAAGMGPEARAADLTAEQEASLRSAIEQGGFLIEGELKRNEAANIKRLKDIGAYRGLRHSRRLPVRGQRTKTNARTWKGAKKTMGSGRKKVEKK